MRDLHSFVQWLRPKPFAICLGAALSLAAPASKAESLKEALTAAYLFNPTLKAARAQLRSADNGVALAKSGYRPQIYAVATGGSANTINKYAGDPAVVNDPLFSGTGPSTPRSVQLALQQNVFDGFRTYNAVKGAEAAVEAGREDLRAAEQGVLLNAATAYMNVVRDQAIVLLRQDAVREFAKQLTAVERRFQVGGISHTDVYQTQTALASAEADLSIAQGTLDSDRALFAQYIGHPPGSLREPGPATRLIPASLDQANTIAESENPVIIAAIFREHAQGHQVKHVKGQLLPSLSVNATYGESAQIGNPYLKQTEDARVIGTLSLPLYEGGAISAQIRGAVETQSQRREQIDEARELARQRVSSAWGAYLAAKGNIAAGRRAVESARLTLTAIHGEQTLGQKSTTDVLGAIQTNLNVRVAFVSFRHDLIVATYSVLEGMGRLDASTIALEAELYDPTRYYGEVKDAWYGWGASVESREDPRTAPVTDPGLAPGQNPANGPAYTQTRTLLPWSLVQ
jgi:outer membrane protein